MSRYIDADKALEIWKDQDYIKLSSQETKARIMLDAVPSADVVEVVRCKDCIFYYKYKELEQCKRNQNWDSWDAPIVTETDYCSFGERKDNE